MVEVAVSPTGACPLGVRLRDATGNDVSIETVLILVGGAPAQGWGGDTARRATSRRGEAAEPAEAARRFPSGPRGPGDLSGGA